MRLSEEVFGVLNLMKYMASSKPTSRPRRANTYTYAHYQAFSVYIHRTTKLHLPKRRNSADHSRLCSRRYEDRAHSAAVRLSEEVFGVLNSMKEMASLKPTSRPRRANPCTCAHDQDFSLYAQRRLKYLHRHYRIRQVLRKAQLS